MRNSNLSIFPPLSHPLPLWTENFNISILNCKKGLAVFPSPAGMSLTKVSSLTLPGIIYPVPVPGRFGQNKSRNLVNFLLQCNFIHCTVGSADFALISEMLCMAQDFEITYTKIKDYFIKSYIPGYLDLFFSF